MSPIMIIRGEQYVPCENCGRKIPTTKAVIDNRLGKDKRDKITYYCDKKYFKEEGDEKNEKTNPS